MTSAGIEIGKLKSGLWVEIFEIGNEERFPTVIPFSSKIGPDKIAIKRMNPILGITYKKIRDNGGKLTVIFPNRTASDLEWLMCIIHQDEFTEAERQHILSFAGIQTTPHGFIKGLIGN